MEGKAEGRKERWDLLVVVVVLGGNSDVVSDQENGVETNTKLTNQVGCAGVALFGELLKELCMYVRRGGG